MKTLKSLGTVAALMLAGTTSAFAYGAYVPMDPGTPGVFENTWSFTNAGLGGGAAGTTFDDFFAFNVPDTESISFSVEADRQNSKYFTTFRHGQDVGGWALFVLADGTLIDTENAKIPHSMLGGSWTLTSGTYVLEIAGNYSVKDGTYSGTIDGVPIPSVPEPASWALLLAGTGIVGGIARRRGTQA